MRKLLLVLFCAASSACGTKPATTESETPADSRFVVSPQIEGSTGGKAPKSKANNGSRNRGKSNNPGKAQTPNSPSEISNHSPTVSPTPASPTSPSQTSPTDDISNLSDEFDNPRTLSQWKRVHQTEGWNADQLERFEIGSPKPGWLLMQPYTSSWYQDWRGVLAFKEVSGDFVMTTRLHVSERNGEGAPRKLYSLAGIMIRTPRNITPQTWRPGGENYIFLSLGTARNPGNFQFEVKTTLNSKSTLEINDTSSGDALIRVVRIGPHFILMKKPEGESWSVHRRYSRPDMPATLQAGLTVYTDWNNVERLTPAEHNRTVIRNGNPDLDASFDYVHYNRPHIPSNLKGQNFSNQNEIPDNQILQLFGENVQ